mgnify:FL=1
MSAAISGMFEFLLQQGGVDAGHIVGKDAAGNPWYFTRCTLGDTVYNFDVATELSVRKGEGLTCFAMTDKELQTGGLQKGFTYSDNEKAPEKEPLCRPALLCVLYAGGQHPNCRLVQR